MTSIDELLRDYRTDVPPPADGAVGRVADRAVHRGARGSRRRRVGALAGTAAALALATVVVILLVQSPASTSPADAPRVQWGMNAVLRVAPEPGVTIEDAVTAVQAGIAERSRRQDVPGLAVTGSDGDRLTVRVPGVYVSQSIGALTDFTPIAIYDTSQRIARFRTVDEAKEGLPKLVSGTPGGFITLPRVADTTLGKIVGADFRATSAEMDQLLEFLNATVKNTPRGQYVAVPVPAGVRLVIGPDGMDVVAPEPVVSAGDISRVTSSASETTLVVRPGRERPVEQSLNDASNNRRELVAVQWGEGVVGTRIGVVDLHTEGRIQLKMDGDTAGRFQLDDANLSARVQLESATAYGTRPPVQGERVDPLPAEIEQLRALQFDPRGDGLKPIAIPPESVLRVLTASVDGTSISVYVARTDVGDEIPYVTGGIGGGNTCGGLPGPPSLTLCPAAGEFGNYWVYYGRVGRTDIATVDVQLEGAEPQRATMQNGWFIAFAPKAGQAQPTVTLIARGSDGAEIGRSGGFGEFVQP